MTINWKSVKWMVGQRRNYDKVEDWKKLMRFIWNVSCYCSNVYCNQSNVIVAKMSYSQIFRFVKILILEKKLYGNRKKILNKVQFKFFIKKIF
jgi:hypothetical protein